MADPYGCSDREKHPTDTTVASSILARGQRVPAAASAMEAETSEDLGEPHGDTNRHEMRELVWSTAKLNPGF